MDEDMNPIKEIVEIEIEEPGSDIQDFAKEAIKEEIDEGIKEAVAEALLEEGIVPTKELVDKGHELLTKEPDKAEPVEEKEIRELPKTVGPMPNSSYHKIIDDTHKKEEQTKWIAPAENELTQREKYEAQVEGLNKFVEEEQQRIDEWKRRHPDEAPVMADKTIFTMEQKVWRTQEEIKRLEQEIARLPALKEKEDKNASEFTKEIRAREKSSREAKKTFITDMFSTGIEANNEWGSNAPSELSNEHDKLIKMARKESEKAAG